MKSKNGQINRHDEIVNLLFLPFGYEILKPLKFMLLSYILHPIEYFYTKDIVSVSMYY